MAFVDSDPISEIRRGSRTDKCCLYVSQLLTLANVNERTERSVNFRTYQCQITSLLVTYFHHLDVPDILLMPTIETFRLRVMIHPQTDGPPDLQASDEGDGAMSAAEESITLDISRDGLIRTLADQFSSRTTFLNELLQNARRAGANAVTVDYNGEAGTLVITDNGQGIRSPKALLTIGQSGWHDLDLVARENPFGIGFAAAIFAARSIRVETRSWGCFFNTSDLLQFKPASINPLLTWPGTRITLHLKEELVSSFGSNGEQLLPHLARQARAFPIPVIFNRQELEAPLRLDYRFKPFAYGHYLCAFNPLIPNCNADIILQGFSVFRDQFRGFMNHSHAFVVHLDPELFRARVPDRDRLIDEKDAVAAVKTELVALWREELERKRAEMTPEHFSERYSAAIRALATPSNYSLMSLLDGHPLSSLDWVGYKGVTTYDVVPVNERRSRSPLAQTDKIVRAIDYCSVEDSVPAVYLYKLGWPAVNGKFSDNHWASSALDLCELQYRIEPAGVVGERTFHSRYVWGYPIVFCDGYTLAPDAPEYDLPSFEIDDQPVYCSVTEKIYIPRRAVSKPAVGQILSQMSQYVDDAGHHDEEGLDKDTDDLQAMALLAFGEDPTGVLTDLFKGTSASVRQSLAGKNFTVSFSEDGMPHVDIC